MTRFASLTLIAWLAGLAAYEGFLRLMWRQTSGSDLSAVGLWSGAAAIATAAIFYTPSLFALRKILGGYKPRLWFPLLATALGVIPTAVIIFAWGGELQDIFSPEGRLFLVMFTAFGLVFGFGYTYRRSAIDA